MTSLDKDTICGFFSRLETFLKRPLTQDERMDCYILLSSFSLRGLITALSDYEKRAGVKTANAFVLHIQNYKGRFIPKVKDDGRNFDTRLFRWCEEFLDFTHKYMSQAELLRTLKLVRAHEDHIIRKAMGIAVRRKVRSVAYVAAVADGFRKGAHEKIFKDADSIPDVRQVKISLPSKARWQGVVGERRARQKSIHVEREAKKRVDSRGH